MANIFLGLVGLVVGSVVAAIANAQLLLPVLMSPALQGLAAGRIVAPAAPVALTLVVLALAGIGLARLRPSLSLSEACIASVLFLCLQAGGAIWIGHATDAVVANVVVLVAAGALAFWLPATLQAWHRTGYGRRGLSVHVVGFAVTTALCIVLPRLLPVSAGPPAIVPLPRNARLPEFGDQWRIAHALAAGTPAAKDPTREANRQAVLVAVDELRAQPCDPNAYFALRRALLAFLHGNLDQWYRGGRETVTAEGRTMDVSPQLDGPALHVFRLALAPRILQPDDLPAAIPRDKLAVSVAKADKSNPEIAALICKR